MYPDTYPQPEFASSVNGVVTADVIADAAAFDQLLVEWDALLASSTSRTPFLKAGWVDCWRRYAIRGQSLHAIAVRDQGRLTAIAPLLRMRSSFSLADRLEFLGTGPAGSDYLDVIVSSTAGPDAIAGLAASLDSRGLPLYLDHLPAASNTSKLATELQRMGWTALHDSPDVCPYIDLSGHTFDSFLATLGSAHRANIRRRMRALESAFDVQFAQVIDHCERREALEQLIRFSVDRWKTRGGTTAFPDPEMIAFHHAITRQAMSEDWLRLYTLKLDGAIVAVMYGFALGDCFYFYQHGFDDAYSRYSVGIVLMAMTIRAVIDNGMREFDMLYGHESYKSLWAQQQRPLSRIQLFPPRITGALLRRKAETRRALKLMAHQLGLNARHDHP
jgi:CelD/BcsL family acetyltransferase involved in cellulose biosynthesis